MCNWSADALHLNATQVHTAQYVEKMCQNTFVSLITHLSIAYHIILPFTSFPVIVNNLAAKLYINSIFLLFQVNLQINNKLKTFSNRNILCNNLNFMYSKILINNHVLIDTFQMNIKGILHHEYILTHRIELYHWYT